MIRKSFIFLASLFHFIKYKLLYRKKVEMSIVNSIKGKFRLEVFRGSKITIGKFLMTRGPMYIKCTDEAKITIGNRCFFNHNCSITSAESITIGNNCMFANNLVIVDHDHTVENGIVSGKLKTQPIIIEDHVWIGANVVILKGVHIGEGSIIAAGAVVTQDIPAHSVAMGVPARVRG